MCLIKNDFLGIMDEIFETDFRFHKISCTTGKVQYLVFSSFSLVLRTFPFCEENLTQGFDFMQFQDFPETS